MKKNVIRYLFTLCFFSLLLHAEIQLIKKDNNDSNATLLVIGGIHGDEPGGYFSASLLATHYKIKSNNLWVVPNLNPKSIQKDVRGIHGDMNRKFSTIQESDKDKKIVDAIKKIITHKNVSLVLNLHDGNGFYRKTDKGSIFNPNAWGQTCVIDQCILNENQPFGDLNKIASNIKNRINKKLIEKHHTFDVKNTKTKFEDEAMQLSLTYFAVTNNKPAFAIESSKNLSSLSQKVFYHLVAIEEFMKIMDIRFERTFDLNEKSIEKLLKNYGFLTINENIVLPLTDIRTLLNFVPLKSEDNDFMFSHPLGTVVKSTNSYLIYIGNKKISTLQPQYFPIKSVCDKTFNAIIDGKKQTLKHASVLTAQTAFKILPQAGYRVNVIGFTKKNTVDESGIDIRLKDFDKRFSLDAEKKMYRIEFYKNNDFCSMSIVRFQE